MSSADVREQLEARFGGILDESALDACAKLCVDFHITAESLFFKWEALRFNNQRSSSGIKVFEKTDIDALRQRCKQDADAEKAKWQPAPGARGKLDGLMRRNLTFFGRPNIKTETKDFPSVESAMAGPSKVGVVAGPSKVSAMAGPSKVRFSSIDLEKTTSTERKYRYMYEKTSERSEALDDRIDELAEIVQAAYDVEEFGDPAASTEEETTVVGRIVFDADSTTTTAIKLNEAALTLESSRSMGSGARVPLRFDPNVRLRGAKQGTGGVGLFPGTIVALRGRNGGAGWFSVTEVLPLPPLPAPSVDGGDPFTMVVACGPFTADADLKYEPWKQLLSQWKTVKPSVILAAGPFVDSSHPSMKNGDVDMLPAAQFQHSVLEPLQELLDALPGTTALMVPSVRDLISDHAVFPQAELGANLINDPRIYSLPNPCQFSLNGVSFAVSSIDALFHLRKEEFFRPMSEISSIALNENETPTSDAMARLSRHVLQQRSFYPIFPPPLDLAHEVNLDVSHSDRLSLPDSAPSVLILPSKLKQFHKVVDETAVVNPSYASKGTYATLRVHGSKPVEVEISKTSEEKGSPPA